MRLMLELFWVFFKTGAFCVGGGYTMISSLQRDIVGHGWLDAETFAQIVTISQITPGPIATNAATYVGAKVFENSSVAMQIFGAFLATFAVSLPAFIIMLLAARVLKSIDQSPVFRNIMSCVRPAVIGFMFSAVLFFGKLAFINMDGSGTEGFDIAGIIIGAASFYAVHKKNVGPIPVILVTALTGLIVM